MVDYKQIAKEARIKVLEMIYRAQTSHIGSNFSVIDILTVLFEKADPQKDEVVLSAGWKAAAWYYFLWRKGVVTEDELNSYCQNTKIPMSEFKKVGLTPVDAEVEYIDVPSKFIGLTEPMGRWGLRFAGGSMGYGLPAGVGFALAKKLKKEEGKVYVIMSDGEMQCGTTWEAALIAAHHKLSNLIVIIDCNGLQAMGRIEDVPGPRLITQLWGNMGWNWLYRYGHDYQKIEHLFTQLSEELPTVLFAYTVKGKGISFMENSNLYHYKAPSKEEYEEAMKELNR